MVPFNMTFDHPCCLALKWAEITLEFCENRVGASKCPVIFQRHLRIGRKITHFAKQLPTVGLLGIWSNFEWEFLEKKKKESVYFSCTWWIVFIEYRFEFSELDFMKYLDVSFLEGEAIWKKSSSFPAYICQTYLLFSYTWFEMRILDTKIKKFPF